MGIWTLITISIGHYSTTAIVLGAIGSGLVTFGIAYVVASTKRKKQNTAAS